MNIKTFNTWLKEANEVAQPVVKTDITTDVNTIINSLETLATELTEELSEIEDHNQVEEGAGDFIKSWITSMKAAKSQQKVNKIKMNAADLEFAADKAEGDKKKALNDKLPKVKLQATELQKMVDDKFSGKGDIVDRKLSKEKIKGQLEVIKRTTGMEDDPKKKADLKTKMKELAQRAKEEESAINDLEDKNGEAIEAEKKRLADEKAKKDGTDTGTDKKAEGEGEGTPEEEAKKKAAEEEAKKKAAAEEEAKKKAEEEEAKKKAEAEQAEKERLAGLTDEERAAEEAAKKKAEEEEAKKKKEALDDSVQISNDLITRARNLNLNELATEIESKQEWQVAEGTILASNYEAIIKKSESDKILNESKYQVNSVKDAFRRLM